MFVRKKICFKRKLLVALLLRDPISFVICCGAKQVLAMVGAQLVALKAFKNKLEWEIVKRKPSFEARHV